MTKKEIVHKLRLLQDDMKEISAAMDYYSGTNPLHGKHARELAGAADIAGEWADEIEKEAEA